MPNVLRRVLQPIPNPLQQLRRHYLKMLARKWRAEAFRNALRYHGTFSKSNCLLMSLPTLSCGPTTSRPAERALGWWTRFAEISAAVPGLEVSLPFVVPRDPLFLFLDRLLGVHLKLCKVSLQLPLPVIPDCREFAVDVRLLFRGFPFHFSALRQAAFHKAHCPRPHGLVPTHHRKETNMLDVCRQWFFAQERAVARRSRPVVRRE